MLTAMKKSMIGLIVCIVMCLFCVAAQAAQVTVAWYPNVPAPTGYRLYHRLAGAPYDYTKPIWEGAGTECTVTVPEGVESLFVLRAYDVWPISGVTQVSGDSNEILRIPPPPAEPKGLWIKAIDGIIQELTDLKQSIADTLKPLVGD